MTDPNPDYVARLDPGSRAVLYHAEQTWEATRGLITAYRVDTGDLACPDPPPWEQLGHGERIEFAALILAPTTRVRLAVLHITGHPRHRGDDS